MALNVIVGPESGFCSLWINFALHVLPPWCAASPLAQSSRDNCSWTRTSKTKESYNLLISGICCSDGKLTNTACIFFSSRVLVCLRYWGNAVLITTMEAFSPHQFLGRVRGLTWICKKKNYWTKGFLCWEAFNYQLSLLTFYGLFRFSVSSWFSLGRLYVSRNCSISFRLSNSFLYNCSW
jgi:hypothetical protein